MASLGKSIDLYLWDGTAEGRWEATLSNWNGLAYKISRSDLKESGDLPEINSPGVYFLFGKDDETGKPFIYVGEAESALKRILQPHSFEKDGSYWTEVVLFVTKDETLDKGKVKYLENRFYTIATETKRYVVKNANTPTQSSVSRQIRDMLEEFILNAKLIVPALGHKAFEPLPSSAPMISTEQDELLYFNLKNGKGGAGIGRLASDGFWVLKGSYIYPEVAEYSSPGIKKYREMYSSSIAADGILTEDLCFGSPSYAAAFVCGRNISGPKKWKTKDGIPMGELDSNIEKKPSDNLPEMKTIEEVDDETELLHLRGKKVQAQGRICADGFVVCKGSEMSSTEVKSCKPHIHNRRKRLVEEGLVKDGTFVKDVVFGSSSTAASCVLGRSANGNDEWLYVDGASINDRQRKND